MGAELAELEQARAECEELRSECELLRELEEDFDNEKTKLQNDLEKLRGVSQQALDALQREKKAANSIRTKYQQIQSENVNFSAKQVTLERANDDLEMESRITKSRLRALEEKIEADLEESVFVKYELEDTKAENERLKQFQHDEVSSANALQHRCDTLMAEVSAKAEVIKGLKSFVTSLEQELLQVQKKPPMNGGTNMPAPIIIPSPSSHTARLSAQHSLKRPRPRSAEGSPTGSQRKTRSTRSCSEDPGVAGPPPPLSLVSPSASEKVSYRTTLSLPPYGIGVAARASSAPLARQYKRLNHTVLLESLQKLVAQREDRLSKGSPRNSSSSVVEHAPAFVVESSTVPMHDTPSAARRRRDRRRSENPENTDTDLSTDEIEEMDIMISPNFAVGEVPSPASDDSSTRRKLKLQECEENPEGGSSTDTDMPEPTLSRSSLAQDGLRVSQPNSNSKKRKRSPRKDAKDSRFAFNPELASQAAALVQQIQVFNTAFDDADDLPLSGSAGPAVKFSPIKSPPPKRRSGKTGASASKDDAPEVGPEVSSESETADQDTQFSSPVIEELFSSVLGLVARDLGHDSSEASTSDLVDRAMGALDLPEAASASSDLQRSKNSRFRALFRMIHSRSDTKSPGPASDADASENLNERLHDLEERLSAESDAREEAEDANRGLMLEIQRCRHELRELHALMQRVKIDDESFASAPTPSPVPSSPRKSLVGSNAVSDPFYLSGDSPRFSQMDSMHLSPPMHGMAMACSPVGHQPPPLLGGLSGSRSLLASTRTRSMRTASNPVRSPSARFKRDQMPQMSISVAPAKPRSALRKPATIQRLLSQGDSKLPAATPASTPRAEMRRQPSYRSSRETSATSPSTSSTVLLSTHTYRQAARGVKVPGKPKSNGLSPSDAVPRSSASVGASTRSPSSRSGGSGHRNGDIPVVGSITSSSLASSSDVAPARVLSPKTSTASPSSALSGVAAPKKSLFSSTGSQQDGSKPAADSQASPARKQTRFGSSIGNALMNSVKSPKNGSIKQRAKRSIPRRLSNILSPSSKTRTSSEAIDTLMLDRNSPAPEDEASEGDTPKKAGHLRRSSLTKKAASMRSMIKPKQNKSSILKKQSSLQRVSPRPTTPLSRRGSRFAQAQRPCSPPIDPTTAATNPTTSGYTTPKKRGLSPATSPRISRPKPRSGVAAPSVAAALGRTSPSPMKKPSRSKRANDLLRKLKSSSTAPAAIEEDDLPSLPQILEKPQSEEKPKRISSLNKLQKRALMLKKERRRRTMTMTSSEKILAGVRATSASPKPSGGASGTVTPKKLSPANSRAASLSKATGFHKRGVSLSKSASKSRSVSRKSGVGGLTTPTSSLGRSSVRRPSSARASIAVGSSMASLRSGSIAAAAKDDVDEPAEVSSPSSLSTPSPLRKRASMARPASKLAGLRRPASRLKK